MKVSMYQKYKSQSLAIVLVLLIVGSVIGFALYARGIREAERVVDEKAASEANELTETMVGLIGTSGFERLKNEDALSFLGCESADELLSSGCTRYEIALEGEESLDEYFSYLGLDSEIDFSEYNLTEDYCFTEISMRYALEDDEVTIQQDDVYSLFFNKVEDWSNCSIDFYMTDNGESEGFVMSTYYGSHGSDQEITSYKNYDHEDIIGFSYTTGDDNWEFYSTGEQALSFPSQYPASKDGSSLHEVRFKSLADSSNLRWVVSGCGDMDQYLVMEVGATCGGKYIGKSFVVPGEVFAPPVFDYVLFNGKGELAPEPIVY